MPAATLVSGLTSRPDGAFYVRQPALHGQQLAFVAEGDIWVATLPKELISPVAALPDAAAVAPIPCTRLTSCGTCSHPHFSPDGRQLAYTASLDEGGGASEVHVVDARGCGQRPHRLTYLGEQSQCAGWTRDGRHILFRTSAEQPMDHHVHLWRVVASGDSRPSVLPLGIAHHLCELADGSYLLGRYTVDPAHTQWKGYAGGAAGHLWHGRRAGDFVRLPLPEEWNVGHPCHYGGRVYFVSDHGGTSNVHSMPMPEPSSPAAVADPAAIAASILTHTSHDVFGAREPSLDASGSGALVYHCEGSLRLMTLEPAAASTQPASTPAAVRLCKVGVGLADDAWCPDCLDDIECLALHPDGHSLLLTLRGRLFALAGLWDGPASQCGRQDDVRYRCAGFTSNGRPVSAVCQPDGGWAIEVFHYDPSDASPARTSRPSSRLLNLGGREGSLGE